MENNIFILEDVHTITNRGLALTGRIKSGDISDGDFIKIGDDQFLIINIDKFRKSFNTPGDNFGILINPKNITKEDVKKHRLEELVVMSKSEIREDKLNKILKK